MKFQMKIQNAIGQHRYYIKLILNKYLKSTEKQLLDKQNNQNYKNMTVFHTRIFVFCRYSRQ